MPRSIRNDEEVVVCTLNIVVSLWWAFCLLTSNRETSDCISVLPLSKQCNIEQVNFPWPCLPCLSAGSGLYELSRS